jgi:hypothetical protein
MAEGGGRRGAAVLAYVAGGLIALGLLALLVLVITGQDDETQSAPGGGSAAEGPSFGDTGAEEAQDDEQEGAEPAQGIAPARGFLTLGSTQGDLLRIAQEPGELAESVGQPVVGSGVPVQQVTSRGAWLGESPSARVWVRLTDSQVRNLRNDDRVTLEGSINAVYLGGGQIGLAPEEGLEQVNRQGGYIRPTSVEVQR